MLNIYTDGLSAEEPTKREQTKKLVKEAQETTQQAERPRGVISDIGDAINKGGILTYLDEGLENLANTLEGTFAGDQLIRPIADVVPNDEELREFTSNIPVVGKAMTAFETGTYQGAMTAIGLTPAARIFNQQANWDNRPEVLKDANILENGIYDTAKIATPTMIWLKGRGAALVGSGGLRLVESMVEAIGQDSAEDLIAGRQLAGYMGNIYGDLTSPEEGAKFTRDLIAGDNAAVAPFLYTWAVMNNMTINTASDYFFGFLGQGGKRLLRNLANNGGNVEAIAKATGKTPDEVVDGITNIRSPEYSTDVEPGNSLTSEAVNLQQVPTDGRVNLFGFLNKLRAEQTGVGLDLNDPSNFFYDWSKVGGGSEKIQMQLQKAFLGKIAPEAGSLARARILRGTAQFILNNNQYIGKDNEMLLHRMLEYKGFKDTNPTLGPEGVFGKPSPATFKAHQEMEADMAKYFEANAGIDINTEQGIIAVAFSRYLGEQAGANLVTVANQIAKMKQVGQDPQKLIDDVLIPNQRFMRAALTPLRRAKRQFFLLGESQQDVFQSDLRTLLGEIPDQSPSKGLGKDTGKLGIKIDGELVTFEIDGTEVVADSIEMLNDLAKQGNTKAKEVLDLALANIQFGDPKKVIGNLELTEDIIKEAMQTKDGWQKFFYNFAALGGLSTQTNAAGATVFRQVLEPIALAVSAVNPMNRYVKPIDGLYGLGQLAGGMYHLKSSVTAGLRAIATNIPASGKDRFSESYSSNLNQELIKIRQLHRYEYSQELKNGTNPLVMMAKFMGRLGREVSYHPLFNTATRLLMAGDEAAKVTSAGQIAWGRAFVELWNREQFTPREMMEEIAKQEKLIFRGPAWKGDIIDPEVKAVSERQTLQETFDIGPDSNPIERYFAASAEANKMSMIQRVFNAFPRAAYRQLEQEFMENVAGATPLGRFNKKIQAIRNNPDQTQRLALDSQMSLAQLIAASLGTAQLMSMYGPGPVEVFGQELPRVEITPDGIVVEGEEYDNQIAYDKYSPATVLLSIIGNFNEAFITGQTSEEAHINKIGAFTFGILSGLIDRNMLQGQQKFARTVDVSNPSWAQNAFGFLWDFVSPNTVREVADLIQPYETVQDDRSFPGGSVLSSGARTFSNIQNPPIWDIYNRDRLATPKPKVGTVNPFSVSQTRQGMAASLFWPGRVTPTRYFDPVMKAMTKYGYSVKQDYLRRIHEVELNPDEQSLLSREIQGNLYPELKKYVNSATFKKTKQRYSEFAKKYGAKSEEALKERNRIFQKFNRIHDRVKRDAIIRSDLYNNPRIREALETYQLMSEPTVGSLNPERKGLYADAAQTQDTQLASEVRNLLDIPV